MKLSELTYITQDIIDKGGINVSSPEMLDEARRYNMAMVTNAARKKRVNMITGIWIVIQMPFMIVSVMMYLSVATLNDWSYSGAGAFEMVTSYARLAGLFIGLFAYLALHIAYIIVKGQRDPKTMLLCGLPVLLTTGAGVPVLVLNVLAGLWYTKTDEKLSEEAGYPAFVRLAVTTMDSESSSIHNMTYDSIRERAKLHRHDSDEFL